MQFVGRKQQFLYRVSLQTKSIELYEDYIYGGINMAFCINCGQKLAEGAKFCSQCGKDVNDNKNSERKSFYDGEIHKCPNCGDIIDAYEGVCEACGYEIRERKVSDSVSEFSSKLELMQSEEQRINFIRSYPIPNTKEAIWEFMILASTNVVGENNKNIFNAWIAKFEQSYQKAHLLFCHEKDSEKIKELYEQTMKQLNKEKATHSVKGIGKVISRLFEAFPNPVFKIVTILVIIYLVFRIAEGRFAGIDIIAIAIILSCVYNATNKKEKKK